MLVDVFTQASDLEWSGFEVRVPLGSVQESDCLIGLLQSHWAGSSGNGLRAHSGALLGGQ